MKDKRSIFSICRGTYNWMQERFPVVNVLVSYVLVSLIFSALQQDLFDSTFWWTGIGVYFQFLLLRVIDEHKDFEQDRMNHPDRVLQRNLISLFHLKVIGVISFISILLITLFLYSEGSVSVSIFGLMISWTLLMTYEFFCSQWLNKHFLIYSLSHMFVLPIMVVWAGSLSGVNPLDFGYIWYLLALVFSHGFSYEIVRKTKGVEEEKDQEMSYSKIWGPSRSTFVISFSYCVTFALAIFLSWDFLNLPFVFYVPLLLTLILSQRSIFKYRNNPIAKLRSDNEKTLALYSLVSYVLLILVFTGVI